MHYTFKYFEYIGKRIRFHIISDKDYRVNRFIQDFQRLPDLEHPKTFNEKLLYRMLGYRDPLFTELADKLRMRERVKHLAGEEYLVPLLGVYNHVSEINFSALPDKFVLKCNHDSGSVIICHDKKNFDIQGAKKKLNFCMKRNMYYSSREWQYKNIEPRILCETYLKSSAEKEIGFVANIYRTHCFDGIPAYVEVEYLDMEGEKHIGFYDTYWQLQSDHFDDSLFIDHLPEPGGFKKMLSLARVLTSGIDYCRADFYIISGRIYFSEFTFSPSNGREKFNPGRLDELFGLIWTLPSKHN